jgi:hypothetical protein
MTDLKLGMTNFKLGLPYFVDNPCLHPRDVLEKNLWARLFSALNSLKKYFNLVAIFIKKRCHSLILLSRLHLLID